jgi:hypothetical protein
MAWREEIEGGELLSYGKFCFQRLIFSELADPEHAEAQDMALFIHWLHDGIVRSRSHQARASPFYR